MCISLVQQRKSPTERNLSPQCVVLFLIIMFAERTVEDDADGGWTETLTDATGSCGSGAAAVDDAVEAAAGGMAAVSVSQSDEVDFDDIPDADDEAAAVSLRCHPHPRTSRCE